LFGKRCPWIIKVRLKGKEREEGEERGRRREGGGEERERGERGRGKIRLGQKR
jgi:hypothetical protein